jgi:hypothetical protein
LHKPTASSPNTHGAASPAHSRRPRPRAVWLLGAGVLGLHLMLLQRAPGWLLASPARAAQPAAERDRGAAPVPVQLLPPPEPAVARSTPTVAAAATAPISPPPPLRSAAPKPARTQTATARAESQQTLADTPSGAEAGAPSSPAETPPVAADPSVSSLLASATSASDGLTATRAEPAQGLDVAPQSPPSVRLDYRLERGYVQGSGVLEWRNEGRRYRLSLEGRLPLLGSIFVQHSEGGFDAAGLAPLRHTEQRLRRSERAVNFVRPGDGSAPRITFSASTASLPLRPGAQDRVSWMAQLATRLAGARRLPTGSRLEMDVASSGGEVQHWVFVLQQIAADGSWHWRRQSDHPNDTLAEVWTDPALDHWPRRVRLTESRGDALELTLRQRQALPP